MPTAERPRVAHRRRSVPPPQPKSPAWSAALLPSQRCAADGRAAAERERSVRRWLPTSVCDVGLRVPSDVGEVPRRQASVVGGGDSPRLMRLRSELIETSVPARVDAGRRRRSKG
jgi:hypothetical protein